MSHRKLVTASVVSHGALGAGTAYAAAPLRLGPVSHAQDNVYKGYYDGHKDGYIVTDVSTQAPGDCTAHQLLGGTRERQGRPSAVLHPGEGRGRARRPRLEPGRRVTTRSGMSRS